MKEIINVLKSKYLIVVIYFGLVVFYGVFSVFFLKFSTGFEIGAINFENHIFSDDQDGLVNIIDYEVYSDIEEEFGADNVTRSTIIKNDGRFSYYAVDSSFLDTGVSSYNKKLESDVIQNVDLIAGSVWGENSEDKSIIIDQRAAEFYNVDETDIGFRIEISGIEFRVAGIVSNTDLTGSGSGNILHEQFMTGSYDELGNIYMPYYYSGLDFYLDSYHYQDPDSLIIKTNGYFSIKDATSKLLNIVEVNHPTDEIIELDTYSFNEVIRDEVVEIEIVGVLFIYYSASVLMFYAIKKMIFE